MFILSKISWFLYLARLAWNCLFTLLSDDITPKWNLILSQPQKGPSLGENTLYDVKIYPRVRPGCVSQEKIQYIHNKKVTKRDISPIWREAPAEQIEMKIWTGIDLEDVIMGQVQIWKKIRDFDVMWVKIAICHGLCMSDLPQRSATAMPWFNVTPVQRMVKWRWMYVNRILNRDNQR